MSKATEVLDQIQMHYTYEGRWYMNHQDLQGHLCSDKIDREAHCIHKHNGYETSFDGSMCVLFYSDNSALVINSNGGLHAVG